MRWNRAVSLILGYVLVVVVFASALVLLGVFLVGIEVISQSLFSWVVRISVATLGVVIILFLPNAVISSQPRFAARGMLGASFVFGATLWVFSFLLTLELWGYFALILGLSLSGAGILPFALLAALFKGMWLAVGAWLLLAALMVSLGIWSEYLFDRVRQNEPAG